MKIITLIALTFLLQSCEKINLPDPMRLSKVGLINFSMIDSNNMPWDSTSGPDLYLEVYKNKVLYFKSDKTAFNNVISLPVFITIDTPIIVQSTKDRITYRLFDIDSTNLDPIDSLEFGPQIIFKLPASPNISHRNTIWQCFYDTP